MPSSPPGGRAGALLLASAALFAGASGCLAGPGADEGPSAQAPEDGPDPSLPSRWSVQGCNGYSIQAAVPADATRGSLPEGFTPAGDDPQDDTQRLFVDAYRCRQATLDGEVLGPVHRFTAKVEVEPPDGLSRSGDAAHYLYLATLVDAERLAEAIQAAGLPARHATPTVDTLGGPARVGTGQAAHADASGGLRVATGNLTANELAIPAEGTRTFGLDRPLGAEGKPRVTTVVDRDLTPTNITLGEGNWTLAGPILPDAFPQRGPGAGFDTQEGTYGETFRVRELPDAGTSDGTEASSPSPRLAGP